MSSKYTVVEHPTLQPAVDYLTKSGVGPFIDTGTDIKIGERKFGRIYLSESSIREMAEVLGITEGASSKQLEAAYIQGKIDALKEGLGDDLSRVADSLARWGDVLGARVAAVDAAEADATAPGSAG